MKRYYCENADFNEFYEYVRISVPGVCFPVAKKVFR